MKVYPFFINIVLIFSSQVFHCFLEAQSSYNATIHSFTTIS